MAEQVATDMPTRGRDRRLPLAARPRAGRSTPTSTDAPASRAGCSRTVSAASPGLSAELSLFAGRTIDVPAAFVSGRSDWGVFQRAGSFEAMQKTACTRFWGAHLVEGAGHWVQQEQPEKTASLILQFLKDTRRLNGAFVGTTRGSPPPA